MPSAKPFEEQHVIDYRPRFTEHQHELILELTATLTEMNGGVPIPRNVVLRALVQRQLSQVSVRELHEVLLQIHAA